MRFERFVEGFRERDDVEPRAQSHERRSRPEPDGEDIAALLDAAEDIVNSAAPDILQEFEKKQGRKFMRRKKRK